MDQVPADIRACVKGAVPALPDATMSFILEFVWAGEYYLALDSLLNHALKGGHALPPEPVARLAAEMDKLYGPQYDDQHVRSKLDQVRVLTSI